MSKYVIDSATLSDIADAIRTKTKDTATMTPADMPAEIESIEGGNPALLHLMLYRTLEDYAGGTPVSEIDLEDATEISDYLFYNTARNCYYNSVRGDHVTVIHSNAFYSGTSTGVTDLTKSLTSVSFPELVTLWQSCFSYVPLESFIAPATLQTIGQNCFSNCDRLSMLDLTAATQLTRIEYNTFRQCTALTEVTIPAGVTFIGNYAFERCSALATIRFLGRPTNSLSSSAFSNCPAITDIYVPWAEGAVSGAPWGATNATIHYNTPAT